MEHGREVYTEEKKTSKIKSKLLQGKNWLSEHKGEVVLITLSSAALATYATYYIFEGKNYKTIKEEENL